MSHEKQAVMPSAPPARNRLIDQHGRTFDYLRIAVTERCNLRCVYCMPEDGIGFTAGESLLTADEILRIIRVATTLGVNKIRITGGEPLVRKDILPIVSGAAKMSGIEDVHLTTNGLLLARHADDLLKVGLSGVNISLDTLNPDKFERITRRTGLEDVVASIRLAVRVGFPSVKVNVVAMRGENDDELLDFVALARELPITVRFIELMPFDTHQVWKTGRFLSAERIVKALGEVAPDLVDSDGSKTEKHIYSIPGHTGKVAVIPSFSRTLCEDCNRVRVTADGTVRNCLYSEREFDLRTVLREGGDDKAIVSVLKGAMWRKHRDGWDAQKANGKTFQGPHRESMTQIGG